MDAPGKLIHGAVTRSLWCDRHNLPHVYEYVVYSTWETAGQFNMAQVRTVRKCDMR